MLFVFGSMLCYGKDISIKLVIFGRKSIFIG